MTFEKELKQIDDLQKQLDTYRPLAKHQIDNLKVYFDLELTYNSNAIEGNTLDISETKLILLEGITISGKSLKEHLEVINHKNAIDFIEDLAGRKKDIEKRDVLDIHSLILQNIDKENAGRYRQNNVYAIQNKNEKHIFPDFLHVSQLMDEFFVWMNNNKNTMHPILFAAEVNMRFVSIHPFIDGNGRTARLLMNLVLMQNNYVPIIIKMKNRKEYIDAIVKVQKEKNMTDFYKILIDAEDESLKVYIDTIKNKIIWK